jgi:integrase
MDTTYDVRIYKTDVYKSQRKNGSNTHWVRWKVAGRQFKEPYRTAALAESFRAELVAAARKGEAFRVLDGLPVSKSRMEADMPWFDFACKYVDMRWPRVAGTTRRTHAEAMTAVTVEMLANRRGMPEPKELRAALSYWGFNTAKRDDCGDETRRALQWVRTHCLPVSALRDPATLRRVLDGLTVKLDGKPAAATVVRRKRSVLSTSLEYAVELKLLDANPIPALKWSPPATSTTVDRRRVASPMQARTLLAAVKSQQRTGGRLVAFFGCLYFAALRPEEAVALHKHNLSLPESGWGELVIERAEPHAGRAWTDDGTNRDTRGLKHRARGESRVVPCPPELTALLRQHLDDYGTGADGRIFRGERTDSELPKITIRRAWDRARRETFTPEVYTTALARTPYDLRHAAVSTWLNGGVPPTTVAEWAGHSVEVLLSSYAKCLDGTDVAIRNRVLEALGHTSADPTR